MLRATSKKGGYTPWLLKEIGATNSDYLFLSNCLNNITYYWTMTDDKNRATDALDLRDRYIDDHGDGVISELPESPTVLEVLCALAERADMRMEGDAPYTWLVMFYENFGFGFLTNDNWTEDGKQFVISTIRKWLDRRFSHNGSGSPFRSSKHDLTKISIWNSMQWHFADEFGEDHI